MERIPILRMGEFLLVTIQVDMHDRLALALQDDLTGKIDENTTFDSNDFRNTLPRFTPEARKANQAVVDLLGKIAQQKNVTPAQIALAWLLAQKPWIVPIPGTTKLHRLEENLGAAIVELSSEDLRELEAVTSKVEVQGARYPEELQKLVGR